MGSRIDSSASKSGQRKLETRIAEKSPASHRVHNVQYFGDLSAEKDLQCFVSGVKTEKLFYRGVCLGTTQKALFQTKIPKLSNYCYNFDLKEHKYF